MKKVNTIILVLAVLFIIGCRADEDSPNPSNQNCQLTQIDQLQGFSTIFVYNAAQKISKWSTTINGTVHSFFTVDYNNSEQVIKTTHDNGYYETYEYNTLGLMIKKSFYNVRNAGDPISLSAYYTYEYNSDNKVSKRSKFDAYQGIALESFENYTYPTANAARLEGYIMNNNFSSLAYIHEFSFDNKIGLHVLLGGLDNNFGTISNNNILSQKQTDLYYSSVDNTVHTYQYNSDGYPVKRTIVQNGGPNSTVFTYSYNCKVCKTLKQIENPS